MRPAAAPGSATLDMVLWFDMAGKFPVDLTNSVVKKVYFQVGLPVSAVFFLQSDAVGDRMTDAADPMSSFLGIISGNRRLKLIRRCSA